MKITQKSISAFLLSTLAGTASFGFVMAEEGFEPIEDVPQNPTMVAITPYCNNIQFTIEPADSVQVSTSPPNLVTAKTDAIGYLTFELNSEVTSTATSGGVIIGIPAGQFQYLTVASNSHVQIADGFTTIFQLDVSGDSTITADLSSSTMRPGLTVSGASTINVKTAGTLSGIDISGASTVTAEAQMFQDVQITGASTAKFVGDVDSGSVSGASKLTVTGSVSGDMALSGASTIDAGSCSDEIVTADVSVCNSGEQDVTVDIDMLPMTREGTKNCGGGSGLGLGNIFGGSSASIQSCVMAFTTAATAAACIAAM